MKRSPASQPSQRWQLLRRATEPPALLVLAALQALALLVVAGRYLIGLRGAGSRAPSVTGDFTAFYCAGSLIRRGAGEHLYDLSLQHRAQSALAGRALASWQPYVNPPALALIVAPLSALSLVPAFYGYCALMAAVLALGLVALGSALPQLRGSNTRWATAVLLAAAFHPLFRTTIGGQNTPLTFSLLAIAGAAIGGDRQLRGGLALGLLSFKPQFLVGPLLLLVLRARWRALAVTAATIGLHLGVGAVFCGARWPLALLGAARVYRPLEWAQNLPTHFSLLPFFEFLLPAPACFIAAGGAALLVVAHFVRTASRRQLSWSVAWGLAVSASMLLSPHLQYYDVGLLVLPVLLAVEHTLAAGASPTLSTRGLLAVGYLGYPIYARARQLRFQPLLLWLLLVHGWLARRARADRLPPRSHDAAGDQPSR